MEEKNEVGRLSRREEVPTKSPGLISIQYQIENQMKNKYLHREQEEQFEEN